MSDLILIGNLKEILENYKEVFPRIKMNFSKENREYLQDRIFSPLRDDKHFMGEVISYWLISLCEKTNNYNEISIKWETENRFFAYVSRASVCLALVSQGFKSKGGDWLSAETKFNCSQKLVKRIERSVSSFEFVDSSKMRNMALYDIDSNYDVRIQEPIFLHSSYYHHDEFFNSFGGEYKGRVLSLSELLEKSKLILRNKTQMNINEFEYYCKVKYSGV